MTTGTAQRQPAAGVLLDLDGTLVDSNYLHTLAWWRAFRDLGAWAPMHAIHRLIGMGADQLVPNLLGHDLDGAADARARNYAQLIDEVRPFPGAARLVHDLHELGVRVVLATSSPLDEVDRLVSLLGISDDLHATITADDVQRSKPAADVFEVAMRDGGVDRARALVVGDSVWDVRAAIAAGVGCIGLETGGFSRHELTEAGAIQVYLNVEQLADQLLTSSLALLIDR